MLRWRPSARLRMKRRPSLFSARDSDVSDDPGLARTAASTAAASTQAGGELHATAQSVATPRNALPLSVRRLELKSTDSSVVFAAKPSANSSAPRSPILLSARLSMRTQLFTWWNVYKAIG